MENEKYMLMALEQASAAAAKGEVPIGAVIVKDNQVISSAYNQMESLQNPCAHAELKAIELASQKLNSWRLDGCSIYVTLDPCPMCMGAIRLSRISNVYIAATESRMGSVSKFPILTTDSELGPLPKIETGLLKEDSERILKDFFKSLRK